MLWAEAEAGLMVRYAGMRSCSAGADVWGLLTLLSSASLLQPEAEQRSVQMVCHLERVANVHMARHPRCSLLSHPIEEGKLQQLS